LENANTRESNFKAIDLIDDVNKIFVQVSSDNSRDKVQSSLDKLDEDKYDGYAFKFVSIALGVDHLKKQTFTKPDGILFEPSTDCYDIKRIESDAFASEIDIIRSLSDYLEKTVMYYPKTTPRASVVTYVINQLAEVNLRDISGSPDVNPFEYETKIDVNRLEKWRELIMEYAVYSVQMDRIYGEYDQMAKNKSFAVLAALHDDYVELRQQYFGDELFDLLLERVYVAVEGDKTCNEDLSRDELLVNIKIVLVDAFLKCKVFEKP
jgi:hypothetical protein